MCIATICSDVVNLVYKIRVWRQFIFEKSIYYTYGVLTIFEQAALNYVKCKFC